MCQKRRTVTVGKRQGSFQAMHERRIFNIKLAGESGYTHVKTIDYVGKKYGSNYKPRNYHDALYITL